jgi:hypothetical protein
MLLSIAHKRLFPLLLSLLLLVGSVAPVYALKFNAFWLYRQTGAEDADARKEFQQRYTLGVGPSLTVQPTHAITATASVGYATTERDEGAGLRSAEVITPAAQLSLNNDIFLAQLSGANTYRNNSKGADRTSQSWEGSLVSRWDIPLWPKLRLSHSETSDSNSTANNEFTSAALNWDLQLAKLDYQYSNSLTDDSENNSLGERENHFARLGTNGDFWRKRGRFNFVQQVQTSSLHVAQGSIFVLAGDVFGKLDTADPADFNLYVDPADDPASIDFGTGGSLVVGLNETVHISFKSTSVSALVGPISAVRIYLDADPGLLPLWNLYTRNPSDTQDPTNPWVRDGAQIQGVGTRDDNDNFFIEIAIPGTVVTDEVLLVADVGLPQTITKVEAVTHVDDDFSSNSSDYLTNAGLRIQLTRTLNASVTLILEHQENESGGLSFTNDKRLVDGNLRWTPVPYLSPALGFSENRQDETGEPAQIDRSYSLTLLTVPLPTVNVVFGVTRYERFDGELQTFSSDRYNISSKAQIYPDLSADLTLNWLNSDAWDSNRLLTASSSFSSRLNLNAHLTRALTADFGTSYRTNQSEIESPDVSSGPRRTSSEGADAKLGLQFRPSALLALSGAYTMFFAGEPRSDEMSVSMTLALLRTEKARFNLLASRSQAETSSNSVSLNGSWDISRHLSLLTQANLAYGETYFYSILTTLSLRL